MLEEDGGETAQRAELLANVRRLTSIVLDRLEQGSMERTLDQAQTRMLGSIALRSLRLWHLALKGNGQPGHGEKGLLEAQAQLSRKLKDSGGKGGEP